MNEAYIKTKSGDIVVFDESRRPREIEDSNNFEKKLIQENKIETIENRIKEIEEELSKCPTSEEVNQQKFIPLCSISSVMVSLIWPIIDCLLRGNSTIFTSTFNAFLNIYKEIFFSSLSASSVALLFCICLDVSSVFQIKNSKQNYNANVAELATLKRILPNEKALLKQLESEKKILPQTKQAPYSYNMPIKKINDQKCLNELNDYLEFYRLVGIDLPKLYKLYLDGGLDCFFKETGYEFSKEEYEILVDYIKENGPSTILKKVRKRGNH